VKVFHINSLYTGPPPGAGADRTAYLLTILFSQKVFAVRKASDIYRL